VELLYRWQCQQYRDDIDENKIISIEKMANPHQMHSPLLGSDASVARPPLLLWMWLLWPLLLSLPVPLLVPMPSVARPPLLWPLLVPMPSVARPLLLGSMSSSMLVNLCLLMDGGGFANNVG
jgi:hypothetical protein